MILILGAVTGFVAQMIMPGKGLGIISTLLVGVAGSWLGHKYVLPYLDFVRDELVASGLASILGGCVLIIIINAVRWLSRADKYRAVRQHKDYAHKHKYVRTQAH